jgi:hypothetical protein
MPTEGAQSFVDPVVGCPHDTTGRPPDGASPVGATMMPDTGTSSPVTSSV